MNDEVAAKPLPASNVIRVVQLVLLLFRKLGFIVMFIVMLIVMSIVMFTMMLIMVFFMVFVVMFFVMIIVFHAVSPPL